MSQPLAIGAGVLAGSQPQVAADLLAAAEPLRRPDDQDKGQGGEGPDTRVGHQPFDFRSLPGFLLDRLA